MRPACPHIDIPYTKWRLQVLRQLLAGAETSARPLLPFLHTKSYNNLHSARRTFHGSTSRARNNVKDVRRSAEYKVAQRELSKHRERQHEDSAASGTDSLVPTSISQIRKQDASVWNPYEESSIQEIQDLVGDLQMRAKEAAKRDTDEEGVPFEGSILLKRGDPNTPESPLERRLPWDREMKSRTENADIDKRLANNVWAQMLSSPLRLDRGTKARLPRDLMVGWGAIRNPSDGKDYLLPIELSDLEDFREKLKGSGSMNGAQVQQREGEDEDQQLLSNDSRLQPPPPPPPPPLPPPRIPIALSRLALEAMTDAFVTIKPGSKKGERPHVGTISAKINATLVPYRWRHKQEETKAFRKTRERFYTALKREPAADEPDMDGMAKLGELQWQPDIVTRVEEIMRARVLIALEALGRDNQSRRGVNTRKVVALPVPPRGRFYMDVDGRILDIEPEDIQDGSNQTVASDGATVPDWIHGALLLHVGSAESFRTTIEQWEESNSVSETNAEWHTTSNAVPPMVAVNDRFHLPIFNLETILSLADVPKLRELISENKILTLDFWENFGSEQKQKTRDDDATTSFESDVEILDTTETSLDSAGEQVLSSNVTPNAKANAANQHNNAVNSSRSQSQPNHDTSSDQPAASSSLSPYIILVKPRARHAHVLVREIWQLWRYIGCRAGAGLIKS